MNIKRYAKAFKDILGAVNFEDRTGSLQLYGAATAIYRDLIQSLGEQTGEDRHPKHDHIVEKLGYFMDNLSLAVMPVERDERNPQERLKWAEDYLSQVENDLAS
jgi:hypothetical protein